MTQIKFVVTGKTGASVKTLCKSQNCLMRNNKSVHIPNFDIAFNKLTTKDKKDIKTAVKLGCNWIALSYLQNEKLILEARKLIKKEMGIISKIENKHALRNINKILKAKRKNFQDYQKNFKEIKDVEIIKEPSGVKSNYWLITLNLKKNFKIRNSILKKLNRLGYNARAIWKPLHSLKIYKKCPKDNLQNTDKIYKRSLNLPSSAGINYK